MGRRKTNRSTHYLYEKPLEVVLKDIELLYNKDNLFASVIDVDDFLKDFDQVFKKFRRNGRIDLVIELFQIPHKSVVSFLAERYRKDTNEKVRGYIVDMFQKAIDNKLEEIGEKEGVCWSEKMVCDFIGRKIYRTGHNTEFDRWGKKCSDEAKEANKKRFQDWIVSLAEKYNNGNDIESLLEQFAKEVDDFRLPN